MLTGHERRLCIDPDNLRSGHGLTQKCLRTVRERGMCVATEKPWLNLGRGKNMENLWKVPGRRVVHAEIAQTLHSYCLDDSMDVARMPTCLLHDLRRGLRRELPSQLRAIALTMMRTFTGVV